MNIKQFLQEREREFEADFYNMHQNSPECQCLVLKDGDSEQFCLARLKSFHQESMTLLMEEIKKEILVKLSEEMERTNNIKVDDPSNELIQWARVTAIGESINIIVSLLDNNKE